jgi:radical SAM family uncharacterized protein/radical SAM-linked protein
VNAETLLSMLAGVEKPARYLGGEVNEVRKDWDSVDLRVALAFPDMYEVGMSHVGLRILYDVMNRRPDTLCERAFAAWPDLEAELRRRHLPLFTLESKRPLRDFDLCGFTLQYELAYPSVLAMLELGGIPLWAKDRTEAHPIVLGGGPGAMNPEPVADFFDAFLVGEGEEAIHEILDVVKREKPRGRAAVLEALAYVGGVYVPKFFSPRFENGAFAGMEHHGPGPAIIRKRVVASLDTAPYPERPLVSNIQAVHDRVPIELQRGCMRACRFCQVGYIARPNRQRSPAEVFRLAEKALEATGQEEVGFLSLSAGDYGCLNPLLEDFFRQYAPEMVGASLPSLRTETLTPELAELVKRVRKSGFTIAPEAGSARMRRVINKGNDEQDLLRAVKATFAAGWKVVKMYFMVGLPFEVDDDVAAIADLCKKALAEGRAQNRAAKITASASTFVPKPHTPFQFAAMIPRDENRRRQGIVARALRGTAVDFKYHDSASTIAEGFLSRADRRMARVIERVYRDGARLDGWTEHFSLERWLRAMEAEGLSVEEALGPRAKDAPLPWDHIDCLMPRDWMWADYEAARAEVFIPDCALEEKPRCYDCGVCDHKIIKNRVYSEDGYVRLGSPQTKPEPWRVPLDAEREQVRTTGDRARGARFRVHYMKRERAALFGHLDTVTVFERAFRRAGVALVHTLGFNPKPRMSFGPACPVGVQSEAEYVDIEVRDPALTPDLVGAALDGKLPRGFEVHCIEPLTREDASISTLVTGYMVRFDFPAEWDLARIEEGVRAFHGASESFVVRTPSRFRSKRIDLKALVPELAIAGGRSVRAVMLQRPDGSARPGELLEGIFEMGAEEARAVRIVRERAILRETRDAPLVSAAPPIPARVDEARARTDPACGSHVSRGDGDVSP